MILVITFNTVLYLLLYNSLLFIESSVHRLNAAVFSLELHWQFISIRDKLDIFISLDVLLRQICQLGERLPVDSDMDDVVIFCKLPHALPHTFAVTMPTQAYQ